jgi:hypothetical protein
LRHFDDGSGARHGGGIHGGGIERVLVGVQYFCLTTHTRRDHGTSVLLGRENPDHATSKSVRRCV